MARVELNPNDDVFTEEGHLHQGMHLFIGVKTAQHGIEHPPFPQTMYLEGGAMSDPWKNYWQAAQVKIGIGEAPTDKPFADVNNKISSEWMTWLNQW